MGIHWTSEHYTRTATGVLMKNVRVYIPSFAVVGFVGFALLCDNDKFTCFVVSKFWIGKSNFCTWKIWILPLALVSAIRLSKENVQNSNGLANFVHCHQTTLNGAEHNFHVFCAHKLWFPSLRFGRCKNMLTYHYRTILLLS